MADAYTHNLRTLASIWRHKSSGLLMLRIKSGRMRAIAFSEGGLVDGSQFSVINAYLRSSEAHFTETAPPRRKGDRGALARFLVRKTTSVEYALRQDQPVHLLVDPSELEELDLEAPRPRTPMSDLSAEQRRAARILSILGLATQPAVVQIDRHAMQASRPVSLSPLQVFIGPPPVRRAAALG